MANVQTLLGEVVARLGGRTDIFGRALMWLGDAYFELLLTPRFAFYELDAIAPNVITTVENVRSYALTDIPDCWFILSVRDETSQYRIRRSDVYVFDGLNQVQHSGQIPVRYARFGNALEIDPTPGGAYVLTVRYRKRPPELTNPGTHLLGREWDEPLIALAVIKGYEALEQPDRASAGRQLLEPVLALREDQQMLEDQGAEVTVGVEMMRG